MQRSVPVTAALCLALALGVCACAVAAPRMVRLPYWKMDNGMMQIGSTREPLVAVADRLVVELGAPAPAGVGTSQLGLSRAAGIAAAAGGRATRLLAGGALAVVELPPGTDLYKAAELLRAAGARAVQPDMEVWTTLVPDDPRYPDQYHHQIINTAPAWDITTGAVLIHEGGAVRGGSVHGVHGGRAVRGRRRQGAVRRRDGGVRGVPTGGARQLRCGVLVSRRGAAVCGGGGGQRADVRRVRGGRPLQGGLPVRRPAPLRGRGVLLPAGAKPGVRYAPSFRPSDRGSRDDRRRAGDGVRASVHELRGLQSLLDGRGRLQRGDGSAAHGRRKRGLRPAGDRGQHAVPGVRGGGPVQLSVLQ